LAAVESVVFENPDKSADELLPEINKVAGYEGITLYSVRNALQELHEKRRVQYEQKGHTKYWRLQGLAQQQWFKKSGGVMETPKISLKGPEELGLVTKAPEQRPTVQETVFETKPITQFVDLVVRVHIVIDR